MPIIIILEAEAGGLPQVQDQAWLHSEFQTTPDFWMRFFLKKKTKNNPIKQYQWIKSSKEDGSKYITQFLHGERSFKLKEDEGSQKKLKSYLAVETPWPSKVKINLHCHVNTNVKINKVRDKEQNKNICNK